MTAAAGVNAPSIEDAAGSARRDQRAGGVALIVAGLAGLAWFWLELTPPRLGFDDTDSPAVMLPFLRLHPEVYAEAGVALLALAAGLLVGALAMRRRLAPGGQGDLAGDSVTAIGIIGAACLALMGVLRLGVHPLLYVDGLDATWGEIGYLVQQFAGIHGVGQGGIVLLSTWAVGSSVLGVRRGVVGRAVSGLAILPALRLVGIVGPLELLPDELGWLWIFFMAAIPGSMAWLVVLGGFIVRART